MKRIIYTAVALIICASVFGIADYFDAKKQGALVNYSDEVQTTEAVIPEKTKETPIIVQKENLTVSTKKEISKNSNSQKKSAKTKKKNIHYPEVMPNLVVTEKINDIIPEKLEIVELQSKVTDVNKNDTATQVTTKREISMKMFSRAPIREKKLKK